MGQLDLYKNAIKNFEKFNYKYTKNRTLQPDNKISNNRFHQSVVKSVKFYVLLAARVLVVRSDDITLS